MYLCWTHLWCAAARVPSPPHAIPNQPWSIQIFVWGIQSRLFAEFPIRRDKHKNSAKSSCASLFNLSLRRFLQSMSTFIELCTYKYDLHCVFESTHPSYISCPVSAPTHIYTHQVTPTIIQRPRNKQHQNHACT